MGRRQSRHPVATGYDWQVEQSHSLVYSLSYSSQDNRQPGRENADFSTLVQSVTLTFFQADSRITKALKH